jgi:hypothetical protein
MTWVILAPIGPNLITPSLFRQGSAITDSSEKPYGGR